MQGIMGGYYARHDGEKDKVASAIAQHYRPQGPKESLPETKEGLAVSLADKIDTLTGFFGINQKPTGSRDPFALRRAAAGSATERLDPTESKSIGIWWHVLLNIVKPILLVVPEIDL